VSTLASRRYATLEIRVIDADSYQRLPPGCLTYLGSMIPSWDGFTGRDVILDLLAFVNIAPFEGQSRRIRYSWILTILALYRDFFEPLEDAILDDTPNSKLAILTFYNKLLRRWGTELISLNSRSLANPTAVSSLINHGNTLALTTLQSSISVSTCSTVLTFYETIAHVISHTDLRATVRIIAPPSELVYTLYFTLSLSTLTRLCSILAVYKRAFEYATSAKTANVNMQPYPKEDINYFNGFLMDICNCIWRSRAFNASDANALGCLLPTEVTSALATYVSALDTSIPLAGLFSLSYSPVICQSAISYIRMLEDNEDTIDIRHAGPVTQGSLKQLEMDGGLILSWADYRLGVLRYLENNKVAGVGELMYNTMKHLMTAREKTS
jgi:centromere protein I